MEHQWQDDGKCGGKPRRPLPWRGTEGGERERISRRGTQRLLDVPSASPVQIHRVPNLATPCAARARRRLFANATSHWRRRLLRAGALGKLRSMAAGANKREDGFGRGSNARRPETCAKTEARRGAQVARTRQQAEQQRRKRLPHPVLGGKKLAMSSSPLGAQPSRRQRVRPPVEPPKDRRRPVSSRRSP